METLNAVINQVNTILWSYILIVLLIGLGLYFGTVFYVPYRIYPDSAFS